MIIIDSHSIREKHIRNLPCNRKLYSFAKQNRRGYNLAETLFWKMVRAKQYYGLNFTRQKVIGNYIVDFYIRSLSLAIEIDGASHNDKLEYDRKREDYLKLLGIEVFRTTDFDVLYNLEIVMIDLKNFIIEHYSD